MTALNRRFNFNIHVTPRNLISLTQVLRATNVPLRPESHLIRSTNTRSTRRNNLLNVNNYQILQRMLGFDANGTTYDKLHRPNRRLRRHNLTHAVTARRTGSVAESSSRIHTIRRRPNTDTRLSIKNLSRALRYNGPKARHPRQPSRTEAGHTQLHCSPARQEQVEFSSRGISASDLSSQHNVHNAAVNTNTKNLNLLNLLFILLFKNNLSFSSKRDAAAADRTRSLTVGYTRPKTLSRCSSYFILGVFGRASRI